MRFTSVRVLALSIVGALPVGCDGTSTPLDAGSDGGGGMDAAPPVDAGIDAFVAPDTGAQAMPDLTIDQAILGENAQFARMYIPPGSCEIAEGCVAAPGWRTLLMFTTYTPNRGNADLDLGSNTLPDGGTGPNFEYSSCHMHYHFRGYAEYSLLDGDGATAAIGHKQSFCVEDLEQVDHSPGIRTTPQFDNCGFGAGRQGISAGWADDYYPDLPCQWIDVTDVPPGDYQLRVAVNYEMRIAESDYTNDTAMVPITIPADWTTGDPTRACTDADPYQGIGRNCGWFREGVHTCTAGVALSVGCNASCGVGSCDDGGFWDIRICDGDNNCNSADPVALIQQDFGECGSGVFSLDQTCGVARFTCPASGQYTVLYAPEWEGDGNPATHCHLDTVAEGS